MICEFDDLGRLGDSGKIQRMSLKYMRRMFSNIRRSLALLLYMLVRMGFRALPIDRRLIVFESQGDFCDNSWALYQFLRKRGGYHFVWVVAHPSRFVNTADTVFVGWNTLRQRINMIRWHETAAFLFNTHGVSCRFWRRSGQRIISLWHGTPLKGLDRRGKCPQNCDFSITTGDAAIPLQAKTLSLPESKILPLGSPRNDLLVINSGRGASNPYCPAGGIRKLILWMPTFRASSLDFISEDELDNATGLPLLSDEGDLIAFNEFLKTQNVAVLVKIHHLQLTKPVFKKNFSNIIFLTDDMLQRDGRQLYQIIGKSDALLTDYSSVLIDYWIVDKPEGFILDDIEGYKKSRGFLCGNIENYLPGRHIYTQEELKDFVKTIVNEEDLCVEKRRVLRDQFHVALDGSACRRLCEYFNL